MDIKIPLDVSSDYRHLYEENLRSVTQDTGRIMLFAGDQKVEHLNDDFYGEGISKEDNNPEHLFEIASKARIGAFATQMGLLARYGMDYPSLPYIVKLNSKTNLVKTSQAEPRSSAWYSMPADILEFKKTSGLTIVGVGYTIYLGSEYESEMLEEAAQIIQAAHWHGLLTVIWAYPRGKAVPDEKNPHLIAGAAGVVGALGADFVKVNYPQTAEKETGANRAALLQEAVAAAGRTKLICAGGSSMDAQAFLQTLHDQIHVGGASGNATGRNIHQRPFDEAVRFCNAIASITFDNASVADAMEIYTGK